MQLTMKDKIGYGLGDTACGFVWQATMFLLAYFYTDVFGLSAGIMGTLFLVSRVLDAVTDPLMGLLVDPLRPVPPVPVVGRHSVRHRLYADLLHAGLFRAGQNYLCLRDLYSADAGLHLR